MKRTVWKIDEAVYDRWTAIEGVNLSHGWAHFFNCAVVK
jgi:hypothetical protein